MCVQLLEVFFFHQIFHEIHLEMQQLELTECKQSRATQNPITTGRHH